MVVDAVLSWANGPSLVEGILPSYSSDDPFCQTQWDCLDRSRVYLISIAIHLALFPLSHVVSNLLSSGYRNLKWPDKLYWCSCIVANFHAIVVTLAALRELPTYADSVVVWNYRLNAVSMFASGYFAVDAALVYTMSYLGHKKFHSVAIFVHHFLGLWVFTYCTTSPVGWIVARWLITEASTPFVNTRPMLSMAGLRHSPLYMINGVLMLVFFFFFRVVNMVLFFVEAVPRTQEFTTALGPVGTVLGAICIISGVVLNSMWFFLMVKGALVVFFPPKGIVSEKGADTSIEEKDEVMELLHQKIE
eukprot:m.164420 g.164420  ORF g.164420 m.164420 type:complete len:304 (-) comp14400_c0_seq13:2429-3340(-)